MASDEQAPAAAPGDYPPTAFHFKVVFSAFGGQTDTAFQEVSGIGAEVETEDVAEGGENRYVYQLPLRVKHPRLVLKRGIASRSSPVVTWCRSVLEEDFIKRVVPMPLVVSLLNETGGPLRSWSFANAYPVKWDVDAFNSTKNEVVIETLELSYTFSNRVI